SAGTHIAALHHRRDERRIWMTTPDIISNTARAAVLEVKRADQTITKNLRILRKVMEHQDALAEPIRTHLKTAAIGRVRVVPREPDAVVVRARRVCNVFPVVEHDLEHPVDAIPSRVRHESRSIAAGIEQRLPISVAYGLQMPLHLTSRIECRAA